MALTPEQLASIQADLYNPSSIYMPTDVPSRQDTNNRLTSYSKAFKGGAVSGLATLLHGVDLVGDVLGKQLQTPEAVADALDKYVNQYYTPEDTGFDVDVVRGLGNLVTNAVPAILVAIAGGLIAPGAAATGLAAALGVPIYASLEALQEAGAAYDDALEKTNMDVEIAKQKASNVFAANLVLSIGTGYLGGFAGVGKEVAKRSLRYGKAAVGEFLQESSQEVISQSIMKGTVSPEEVLYSGAVGAVVGGTAAPITTKAPKKKDKPSADVTTESGVTPDQQEVLNIESVINQKEEAKTKIRSASIKDAVAEKEQKTLAEQQQAAIDAMEQAKQQKIEQDKIELDLYNKKNSTRDGLLDSVAKYQETAVDSKDGQIASLMGSVHDVLSSASIDGIESIPGSKLTSLMSKVDIWRRSKKVKDNIDLSLANTIYKELDSIKAQQLQTKREEVLSNQTTTQSDRPFDGPDIAKTPLPEGNVKPIRVRRMEEPGRIPDASKPQGLYVNRIGSKTGVNPEMTEQYDYDFLPKNPLDVTNDNALFVHARGRGLRVLPSAGIKALRKLVSKEEMDRLAKLSKTELGVELAKRYPDVEWGRYHDAYEMLEGYAGLLARKEGYDAIIEEEELVALDESALTPIKASKSEALAQSKETPSLKKEEKPAPTTVKEEPTPPVAEVVTPEATPEFISVEAKPEEVSKETNDKFISIADKLSNEKFDIEYGGYQEGLGGTFTIVPKGMSLEQILSSGKATTFYGKNLTEARVKLRQATKDITTAKKEEVKEKTSKKKLTKAEEEVKEKAKEKKPKNKPSKAKPKKEVVEKKVEDEEDVDEFEEELPSKANAKEEGPITLTAEVKKEAKELSKEESDAFINKFEENNSPDVVKFVQNKIKEFGTLSKVDAKYSTGSDIDTYAREKARQLFGRTKQDEVKYRLNRRRIESKKKKEEPVAKPKESISEKKLTKAIAKAFTNRISTKLNGKVRIVVHDSASEVDSETYSAMKRDNALDAKGFYSTSNRTIRIFLDQITNLNDFKKTLWHELGHFSFRDILGSRLDSDLKSVYNKYKDEIAEYAANFDEVVGDENQNEWTEEYIIMKWTDWKTRPIGRKIQDSIMRILGMTERSEFYIYFKPMYDYVKRNRPIRTIVVSEDGFRYRKTPMVNQVSDPLAVQAINAVGVEHPYTFVDRAKRKLSKDFRTQFADYTLPIKQYEEKVTKNLSGYIARRLSASVPTNFGAVLHFGLPRYDQNINWWTVEKSKDGGLLNVIQKLGDTSRWFELWQIARSAEELVSIRRRQYTKKYMDEGLRDTELTDKVNKEVESFKKKLFGKNKDTGEYYKYNEIIRGLKLASDKKYSENKKLWDWADNKLKEFNKAMLDAAQASGIIDPVTRKEWERSIYVPFNREVEDWITGEVGVKGRFAKKSDVGGITRLEGGEGTIGNPINNLIGNYLFLMNESMKNITRIKSFNSLVAAGGINPKKLNPIVGKAKKNAISIKRDGKAEYYEVNDPDLYVALTGLNNDYLNGALFDIMRASKSLLTKGVSFSVGFRMRNLLRDTLTASTIEPSFRPFVDTFTGLKAVMNKSPEYIRLISLGGTFGEGFYNIEDRHSLQAYLNRLFKGTTEAETSKFSIKGMIRAWENIGVALENATRVGLYMRKLDVGGNELDAAFAARDLLDFSKRGDLSSFNLITSVIPFLNARIQGLDKLYQSSKLPENRVNFFANGIVMAGISLLLYAINRDKEEYKDLPEYDKFSNVHFFIGDTHLRMPIPFEYGVIFSKLPQALADVATTGDYKTFLNFLKFSTTQIFEFDPRNVQAFKPLLEISANKSFYTGAPIIPMSLQGLAPKDQYDYSTSSLARLFGDTFNISPKKVDHIIEGYTSSIGVFALNLHNMIANQAHRHLPDTASVDFFFGKEVPTKPALRVGDIPGFGWFAKTGEPVTTKAAQDFYDIFGELDELYQTVNYYRRLEYPEEYNKAYLKYASKASQYSYAKAYKEQIDYINARIRVTRFSKELSAKDKDVKLQGLYKQRNELYKKAVLQLNDRV